MALNNTERKILWAAYELLNTLVDVGPSNPANTARLALAERFRIDTIKTIQMGLNDVMDPDMPNSETLEWLAEEVQKAKSKMDSIRAASQ
ncbi:hypothetical protein [Aeromicrobium sp. 179-A 4D2 NHS]|uniref:hypothetical protein n=1 Tax=Aeromicrobium sp. 179-A 4D2 NHS TaxID=3142375 RepID=UPI00399F08EF